MRPKKRSSWDYLRFFLSLPSDVALKGSGTVEAYIARAKDRLKDMEYPRAHGLLGHSQDRGGMGTAKCAYLTETGPRQNTRGFITRDRVSRLRLSGNIFND